MSDRSEYLAGILVGMQDRGMYEISGPGSLRKRGQSFEDMAKIYYDPAKYETIYEVWEELHYDEHDKNVEDK